MLANFIVSGVKTVSAIVRNRVTGFRTPLLVSIMLTNRCNLDCIYCFTNAHKSKDEDMDTEKVFKIVDELKKAGTILITLTGGEVGLRNDLEPIINYIKDKGMMVEVLTNGIKFKKNLEAMKKVDYLAISIDGDEANHNKNRGKGAFIKAIRAVDLATQNGIHTRIHACFTNHNKDAMPELERIADKYNVRVNVAPPTDHTDDPALKFDAEGIRKFYREMKEYKMAGGMVSNSTATLDFISNWPGEFDYVGTEPDPNLPYLPCKRKDFCMYIDTNGKSYPCAAVWSQYDFNVFEKGVQGSFDDFQKIPCNTCINEAEFHLLFKGSISSIVNVAAFALIDKIKNTFTK